MINHSRIIIGSITQRLRVVAFIICSILVLSVFFLSSHASTAASRPMPLTKESAVACAVRMQNAIESVTPEDQQNMQGSTEYSKTIISKMVVRPITDTGYGFEETVLAIAGQVTSRGMPPDPEHAAALGFILVSVAGSAQYLVSYGLINTSTLTKLNEAADYFIQTQRRR